MEVGFFAGRLVVRGLILIVRDVEVGGFVRVCI